MSSIIAVFLNYFLIGSILSFSTSPPLSLVIILIGTFFFYLENLAILVVSVYAIFAFSYLIKSNLIEASLLAFVAFFILIVLYIPNDWKFIRTNETIITKNSINAVPYRGFLGTNHTISYFSHLHNAEAAIKYLWATGFPLRQISLIYRGKLPQRKPFTGMTISTHFDAMRLNLPDARARFYSELINQNDYVVIVSCTDNDINRAASILSRYGITKKEKLLSFIITICSVVLSLVLSLSKLNYWQEDYSIRQYFALFISLGFSFVLSIYAAIFIDKSTNFLSKINIDFFEESFNDSHFVNSLVIKFIVMSTCSLGLLLGWQL